MNNYIVKANNDKKLNFRRAIKAWREVYRYFDSILLEELGEDDNVTKLNPVYPFRFWSWTTNIGKAIEYGLWGIIEYYNIYKPEEKEWTWYKNMHTELLHREEGDVMPHQHFNLYIWNIIRNLDKCKVDDCEEIERILVKIQNESDIISHWSQNGLYSQIRIIDSEAMPCSVEYYSKIETICADFMNFIKKIMNINDEQDVMNFIWNIDEGIKCNLQI